MALSKKVVVFDLNTTTGNQSVTGVGFEPKLVILFCNGTSSGVVAGNAFSSIGAATSSSARWAVGQWHTDGSASNETARSARTDKILDVPLNTGASSEYQADLVSMDSDGFTINIGTTSGASLRCIALCLGGTDLDVAVGSFSTGTTTGSVTAVSGLAFEPKAVFTAHSTTSASVSATVRYNVGFATGPSNEWGAAAYEGDNQATMITAHGWSSTQYIYGGINTGADTEIDFGSFTGDGWTHNITQVPASLLICYIAFGGSAQYYVGNDAQDTATGTEATTGVGFEPSVLITNMGLRATTGFDVDGDFYTHLGFMDGTSEAGGHVFSDDGTANAETSRGVDSTYSLFAVTDDATPTVAAKASLTSFDSDGFTVNWNVADATARLFGFLAIGAASGGSLNVSATTDALTLAEYAATVGYSRNVSANVDALTLAEYAATIGSATNVAATTDALTLAEYAATIGLSLNVQATNVGLTLTEYGATISDASVVATVAPAGGGSGAKKRKKYPKRVYINGRAYTVKSEAEEKRLLEQWRQSMREQAAITEHLGETDLAQAITRKAVRIEKRAAQAESAHLARLRDEDEEILAILLAA